MDLLVLIQKTRDQLLSHWGLSISVCIVYTMLIAIPSELNTFGEILSLLIAGPLQLGLCIYFLKISRENKSSFYDLFEGFKPLINILLLFIIVNGLTIIGFIFFIIPGIIISLGFSMSYYIIAEKPEMQIIEVLEKSWKMMDGKKMELFMLHLRFLPWYFLGLLFFIVGVFIIMPWHNLALANYYLTIKDENFRRFEN